jgi:hypothetical protein
MKPLQPNSELEVKGADSPAADTKDDDNPMLWCPVCSTHLESQKCKLFCRACGYYMSCADYY